MFSSTAQFSVVRLAFRILITFLNAVADFATAKHPFPLANEDLEPALWVCRLFLIKFYSLPAQPIEIMTAAQFLTLSVSAYSHLFRRPLQYYNMTPHEAQVLFPSLSQRTVERFSILNRVVLINSCLAYDS